MATVSGLTSVGIIRKRMADLYLDFAARIKEGGAFGAVTTVDSPDDYPSDPLVQIAATASVSTAEIWEATEGFYNQLDWRTATGRYLETLHAERLGIVRSPGMTDDALRALVAAKVNGGIPQQGPASLASRMDTVECASFIKSTTANPVAGIPTPGAMLVVKESALPVDYTALAQQIWDETDIGLFEYHGDTEVSLPTANGGCVTIAIQPACRVYVGVRIHGFFTASSCVAITEAQVLQHYRDAIKEHFLGVCRIGGMQIDSDALRQVMPTLAGFVLTGFTFERRPRVLVSVGCEEDGVPLVEINGEIERWESSSVCGYCQGETWCNDWRPCLSLPVWEFPDADIQFMSLVEQDKVVC